MNHRKELAKRDGMRFRCRASVGHFGTKPGYQGPPLQTILLRDVVDAETGKRLTDHLWFTVGKWAAGLAIGDHLEFEARVADYEKGYQGRREVHDAPVSADWKLQRPTKVRKLPQTEAGKAAGTAP